MTTTFPRRAGAVSRWELIHPVAWSSAAKGLSVGMVRSFRSWARRWAETARIVCAVSAGPLAQRSECCAHLFGEDLGLLPGGEVAALVDCVVVGEVGVGEL